jgi:hypothetical protein
MQQKVTAVCANHSTMAMLRQATSNPGQRMVLSPAPKLPTTQARLPLSAGVLSAWNVNAVAAPLEEVMIARGIGTAVEVLEYSCPGNEASS